MLGVQLQAHRSLFPSPRGGLNRIRGTYVHAAEVHLLEALWLACLIAAFLPTSWLSDACLRPLLPSQLPCTLIQNPATAAAVNACSWYVSHPHQLSNILALRRAATLSCNSSFQLPTAPSPCPAPPPGTPASLRRAATQGSSSSPTQGEEPQSFLQLVAERIQDKLEELQVRWH